MGILYGVAPLVVHELAHWIAALLVGSRIRFKFDWGKLGPIKIPRWTWTWPEATKTQIRFICQAGFLAEIALIPFMPWEYQAVALIHYALYPWYAGDSTDYKGMI